MTRKLLTISRRQVVQPQVVDVAATLESLRSVLDVMVGSAVTLDLEIADPPHVLVDPAQFEQVVLNLAINARDAMPKGGTITIRSCGAPDGTSSVLEVGDTGEGMDPETLEHCFEPFFTTKERAKGTGLGLSTVYGVVTQAGGTITVDSRLGEGTTFRVSFPASTEEVGTGASSDLAGGDGLRILVVDDQREVRTVVAEMLELEGHEVVVASSAKRALTALESWPADVMVSDVVMPRMRGTELAARVAAEHPDVGIVLMSGHVDDAQVLDAVPPGVQFIGKPFSARALQAAIGVALSGRPQGSKR
jgi:two-component system cell cycle sensor histidine kinase/response regulator CckA